MSKISANNKRAIRVLHIVGSMTRGGAESWLMSLLRKADRRVLEMDFCVLTGKNGAFSEEIESLCSRVIPCKIKPVRNFKKRLIRLLRENKSYDVVHSHVWSFSGIILKAAFQAGVPVRIAHSHNTQGKYPPSLYRKLYTCWMRRLTLKYATACLGCAHGACTSLFGPNWESIDKCRILYCSIDADSFDSSNEFTTTKSSLNIESDAVVIGNVGNLRGQKNHDFFLDIAAKIIQFQPKSYFFFAGEGELREQLQQKADRLGISKRVIFGGVRKDVPALMRNVFDVMLFPSLYEGMPLTLVEAAAAALPTVCSDTITAEATDVLPENFTRLSLDLPAEQWAHAVCEAIGKKRIEHIQAHRRVKESHFSVDFSLKELMAIYGCTATKA